MRRVRLWRYVSGQPDFDIGERFLRRIEYLPTIREGKGKKEPAGVGAE